MENSKAKIIIINLHYIYTYACTNTDLSLTENRNVFPVDRPISNIKSQLFLEFHGHIYGTKQI